MARVSRGRMHAVERANRMLRNLADSNRAGTSLGLRSPVTANSPHVHVLLGKQVIGLNRGSVIALKVAKDRQGKNHMASLLDLSRRDLLARGSSLQAHDLPKRDRQTVNRELRERGLGVEGCEFADWQRKILCSTFCGQAVRQGWGRETVGQAVRRFRWGRVRAETPRSKESSGTGPREKSGAKPFWAKNPRGGKGSTAAGRSNRPHAKHAARKRQKK